MLQIHLLLQWYWLSDPAMEEPLIELPTMRRFAGNALIRGRIPDETTILTFRHLPEKHELGEQIDDTVKALKKSSPGTNRGNSGNFWPWRLVKILLPRDSLAVIPRAAQNELAS
jgi:hypothetical protein